MKMVATDQPQQVSCIEEEQETRGFGRACVATDLISAKIGDRKGIGNYRYRYTVISGFNASCVVPDTV